jgi:hypothetical protein
MAELGKLMVLFGAVLMALGGLVWVLASVTGGSGGLLPGDIVIRRGNVTVYVPIVTCLLLSAFTTLVLYLMSFLRR